VISELIKLIYPVKCLICVQKVTNTPLCEKCDSLWRPNPRKLSYFDFPVYASIQYDKVAMKIVLLAKEEGNKSAQELLATSIKLSLLKLITSNEEIAIVPIPTSKKPYRRRGINPIYELAKQISLNLQDSEVKLSVAPLLEVQKSLRDQTGLSNSERLSNLAGAFQVKRDREESRPIIVIDDVVATGSTLREAVRALKERNLTVIGAVSACSTFRN
jgi:ComF family protein